MQAVYYALKKLLILIFFAGYVISVSSSVASAASTIPACDIPGSANSSVCKDQNSSEAKKNPIIGIIKAAINVVSFMAGAAAVICILISSIKFMTANGDQNNISSAKQTLVYAAVGIIVVLIAQSIVAFALRGL